MDHPLVFTRERLQQLDRRAVDDYRIPILVLMENAGRAVADTALRSLKHGARVLILAGPGNNGGDGLVAARHLHNAGIPVAILLLAPREQYKNAAATQLAIVDAMRLSAETLSPDHAELRDWLVDSSPADLIIDALFGTGLARPVDGLAAAVILAVNAARHPVLSIDLPSGLDCDTGQPLGVAIHAIETVSFCGLKKGFASGKGYVGRVIVADIGAPRELVQQLGTTA